MHRKTEPIFLTSKPRVAASNPTYTPSDKDIAPRRCRIKIARKLNMHAFTSSISQTLASLRSLEFFYIDSESFIIHDPPAPKL